MLLAQIQELERELRSSTVDNPRGAFGRFKLKLADRLAALLTAPRELPTPQPCEAHPVGDCYWCEQANKVAGADPAPRAAGPQVEGQICPQDGGVCWEKCRTNYCALTASWAEVASLQQQLAQLQEQFAFEAGHVWGKDEARWQLLKQALETPELKSDLSRLAAISATVNSREPASEADIARAQQLAKQYGWEKTDDKIKELEQQLAAAQAERESAVRQFQAVEQDAQQLQRRALSAEAALTTAQQELETERIRLAACTTAALGNTPDTVAQRIAPGHPYWSASYGDVCAAVDREMELRAALTRLQQERQKQAINELTQEAQELVIRPFTNPR